MTPRKVGNGESILAAYGAVICDLDGVVYRGSSPIPGSVGVLRTALESGRAITFATNNASREPSVVEEHLCSLGLEPGGWGVVSSAQAAASYVVSVVTDASPVLAVGGRGVAHALREVGLVSFSAREASAYGQASAVVQGAGTGVNWRDLAEVAYQVTGGALWVATNPDRTIPTARGLAPGNGALVEAVRAAVGVEPIVAGKPEPLLYDLALRQQWMAAENVLVIGDRLDTDIAAAHVAGLDSLFLLSGAHSLLDLVFCEPKARPTYFGVDMGALLGPRLHNLDSRSSDVAIHEGLVRVRNTGRWPEEALTAIVTLAWHARDSGQELSRSVEDWRSLEQRILKECWTSRSVRGGDTFPGQARSMT